MKNNSTLCSFDNDTPSSALYDARYIVSFLQDVVPELCVGNGGGAICDESAMGLGLVFHMLEDKLRIAGGELVLPSADGENRG